MLPLFGSAVAAFARLRKDIETQPSIDNTRTNAEKLSTVEGTIELQDVKFTYSSRPDHPVLNGISLKCEAGQLTAIVGLSGSGKSTVASLLTRFYDPTDGTILLDGKSLKDINVRHLRGFISLVQQEPSLLDRSIIENIALGLVNSPPYAHLEQTLLSGVLASIAEGVRCGKDLLEAAEEMGSEAVEIFRLVQNAAELADVATFINRLEFGFATLVGSGGSRVSHFLWCSGGLSIVARNSNACPGLTAILFCE